MYLPSEELAETKEDVYAFPPPTWPLWLSMGMHLDDQLNSVPRWCKGTLNPGLRDLVPKGTEADIPPNFSLLTILNNSQFLKVIAFVGFSKIIFLRG